MMNTNGDSENEQFINFTLTGGYNNGGGGGYSQANFQDAEVNQPPGAFLESLGGSNHAIQGIVQQSMQRHMAEVLPTSLATSPALTSYNSSQTNWRKRLREMIIRQNETQLSFLFRPVNEHPTCGPAEQALRRYSLHHDVQPSALRKFGDLVQDLSGSSWIEDEVNQRIAAKGPSTLPQLRQQVTGLIDLYKETGERLLETENQLKMRLEKMDSMQEQVRLIMNLQSNDATPDLVNALEQYLKIGFRDVAIEALYKQLITLYQKHIVLREAIQVFKLGSQVNSEPMCPICLNDSVSVALVPCGHTFCSICAKRWSLECGVCRQRIRDRLKIYLT